MTFRSVLTLAGAIGVGALVAACATHEATSPTTGHSTRGAAAAAPCTPTAPVISSTTASPNVLWPPNHKFVPVTVSWSASDNCGGTPTCQISSVTSNEPVNGLGDGNTVPDWIVTSASTVELRAERSGRGNGRIYTVTVTCSNSAGSTTSTTTVTVPHDMGAGRAQCHEGDRGRGDDHGTDPNTTTCNAPENGEQG